MRNVFSRFACQASRILGSPYAFLMAVVGIVVWACLGPSLGYSEQWQLVVNTATTIITFLSVFLIQNSQNRESLAMQLKLDELLRAMKEARNEIIDLEDMPDDQLEKLAEEFRQKRHEIKAGEAAEVLQKVAEEKKHPAKRKNSRGKRR